MSLPVFLHTRRNSALYGPVNENSLGYFWGPPAYIIIIIVMPCLSHVSSLWSEICTYIITYYCPSVPTLPQYFLDPLRAQKAIPSPLSEILPPLAALSLCCVSGEDEIPWRVQGQINIWKLQREERAPPPPIPTHNPPPPTHQQQYIQQQESSLRMLLPHQHIYSFCWLLCRQYPDPWHFLPIWIRNRAFHIL